MSPQAAGPSEHSPMPAEPRRSAPQNFAACLQQAAGHAGSTTPGLAHRQACSAFCSPRTCPGSRQRAGGGVPWLPAGASGGQGTCAGSSAGSCVHASASACSSSSSSSPGCSCSSAGHQGSGAAAAGDRGCPQQCLSAHSPPAGPSIQRPQLLLQLQGTRRMLLELCPAAWSQHTTGSRWGAAWVLQLH